MPRLKGRALWRLGQLLVVGQGHVSAKLDQDGLHGEVPLPLREAWELGCVDLESVSTSLSTVQHEVPVRSVRLRRAG